MGSSGEQEETEEAVWISDGVTLPAIEAAAHIVLSRELLTIGAAVASAFSSWTSASVNIDEKVAVLGVVVLVLGCELSRIGAAVVSVSSG
jgi:hypothetical protein